MDLPPAWERVFRGRFETDQGGCQLWTGASHPRGWGRLRYRGQVVGAHRLSFELATGHELAPSVTVRQVCEKPRCIRFECLYLGAANARRRDRLRERELALARGSGREREAPPP